MASEVLSDTGRAQPAPVALFVYNRPLHAQQTVAALLRNELAAQTDVHVFSDAAADPAAAVAVTQLRAWLRTVQGFRSVRIVEQERNLGLARSIIGGVTRVCNEHGRVIVVEDDLVTSPYFLRFMNDALDAYQDDERVGSIHGYWYPVVAQLPDTFFLRGASCWGWATWARAWRQFEPDGGRLLEQLQRERLTREFDLDGAMAYTKMLRQQIAGHNNSWAIRWHASMFLAGRLQLSPSRSLVQNIGFDGTGTHCGQTDVYGTAVADSAARVVRIPIEESAQARAALIRYYLGSRRSLPVRVLGRLRRIFRL